MARKSLYIGIDLGGTKVHAALVAPGGMVLERVKTPTPEAKSANRGQVVISAIMGCINELLEKADSVHKTPVAGIGLAMPGPVNYAENTVPFMPNLDIAGADLAGAIAEKVSVDITLANDADATAAGEAWFGPAGENAHCFIDIAVGTGIGGGMVVDGKLYTGSEVSCAEIGHIIMNPEGELCGCGNRGCVETIASRTAIERRLRQLIKNGQADILAGMLENPKAKIKSGVLARAFKAGDKAVKNVLDSTSRTLGHTCLSLKHMLAPDVIALGGGVMEACGDTMLPVVLKAVKPSKYMADHKMKVVLSALGDDAAVTGAAAMAMQSAGLTLRTIRTIGPERRKKIRLTADGFDVAGEEFFAGDMAINVYGQVGPRRKNAKECLNCPSKLKIRDLRRACEGGPKIVYIGSNAADETELKGKTRNFLDNRAISYELLDIDSAIAAYNQSTQRKAIIVLRGA